MIPRALLLTVGALLLCTPAAAAQEEAPAEASADELGRAVREVERLDELRSSLAETFRQGGAEADRETFRNVCRPVGVRAKEIAAENGWTVAQMAIRYRNPSHEADSVARDVMRAMERDPSLMGTWREARMDGREGVRYFRRIVVEPACLACHGAKEERPAFVKDDYPDDRAFGFEVGDLRGVYSVFLPAVPAGNDGEGSR